MDVAAEPPRREPRIIRRLVTVARTRTGVLGLTSVGNLLVRTGSSMLLTRLLIPADFGIVGLIGAVFFTVTMLTDLGFQDFLVRHQRTDERRFRDVIWTIHARRGAALFICVALASPIIARAFGKPEVALPLAVASITFLINGVCSLSLITALRRDKSRELSLLDFGLQLFQTASCLLLALWWRNVWAMIAAMVLQSAFRSAVSYLLFEDARQRPARDREVSREFLAFSRYILVSSALGLLIAQSDKLVLGRLFTLNDFGLYAIALTIASAPTAFAQSYVTRIAFPIYAQTWRQAGGEVAKVYYKVRRAASALYGFACGGLIGGAPLLVALLYDPRYAAASKFISLLMISTALRLPNVATSQLLIAAGQVSKTVHVTIVRVLWLALAIPLGFLLLGTTGIVAAVGLIELPAMLYSWILLHRMKVLNLAAELSFIALVGAGAAIGFLVASEGLRLFPHL